MPMEIYHQLKAHYAKKWEKENKRHLADWWPVSGAFLPEQLEIVIGSVLTQNTNWKNVEKAIDDMVKYGLIDAKTITECGKKKLQNAIKPAGFFIQKSETIRSLCKFIYGFEGDFYKSVSREQLLAIKGIGNETADSILLYACGKKEFVVDAYTYRIFSRYGLLKERKYHEIKRFFETEAKRDAKLYKEFHALIVEHAKQTCRKVPNCTKCPLEGKCMQLILPGSGEKESS
jgi:endonuclease-3 related protein